MAEEEKTTWKLIIKKVSNGYILYGSDNEIIVCEEDNMDELMHHESMLWEVIQYFGFTGSKHDKERLRVIRETNE